MRMRTRLHPERGRALLGALCGRVAGAGARAQRAAPRHAGPRARAARQRLVRRRPGLPLPAEPVVLVGC